MIINNSKDLAAINVTILNNDEVFTGMRLSKGLLLEISNYGRVKNIITNVNEEVHNIENQLYVKIGGDFYLIALLVVLHFISFDLDYLKIEYRDNNPENLHVSNIKFTVR